MLPVDLEVREEARYEDEIERAVARDLVGDVDVAAAGVADRRGHSGGPWVGCREEATTRFELVYEALQASA